MQVLLTEEEYIKLKNQASINSTILLNDFYKDQYHILQKELIKTTRDYQALNDKYTKLLVFGVTVNNERLKGR